MFEAQYLPLDSSVFSPWFPRGGENAIIGLDLIESLASTTITVEVFTKNSEATGSGTIISAFTIGATSTPGITTQKCESTKTSGFEEFVRYKFTTAATEGGGVLFRMIPISWFDDVSIPSA